MQQCLRETGQCAFLSHDDGVDLRPGSSIRRRTELRQANPRSLQQTFRRGRTGTPVRPRQHQPRLRGGPCRPALSVGERSGSAGAGGAVVTVLLQARQLARKGRQPEPAREHVQPGPPSRYRFTFRPRLLERLSRQIAESSKSINSKPSPMPSSKQQQAFFSRRELEIWTEYRMPPPIIHSTPAEGRNGILGEWPGGTTGASVKRKVKVKSRHSQ